MEFPTAFLMTNAECYIGKSETRGNIPPLVRAVALPGDGGLANLFCRRAFANLAAFRFTRQGKEGGRGTPPFRGVQRLRKVAENA